jgi:uncharacterized RDD family membrane protein YckC
MPESQIPLAPLGRRAASLVYEALLLSAVLWCAGLLFALIEQQLAWTHARLLYQAYLLLISGAYFVWHWVRGQTLPMKTWHIKLVTESGNPVSKRQALARYLIGTAGLLLLGVGFLWAFVDRERQFLHDRLAGTRIVRC